MICTKLEHYSSGFIDSGYGCGYRNSQMLLSSIREDPAMRDTIFNHSNNYDNFNHNEINQASTIYLFLSR
jgi:hypothetical protein